MNKESTSTQGTPEHEGVFDKIKNKILGHKAVAVAAGAAVVAGGITGGAALANAGEHHDPSADKTPVAEAPVNVVETPTVVATEAPTVENTPSVSPSALPEVQPTSVPVPTEAAPTQAPAPEVTKTPEAKPETEYYVSNFGEGDSLQGIAYVYYKEAIESGKLTEATVVEHLKSANPDIDFNDVYRGKINVPKSINGTQAADDIPN